MGDLAISLFFLISVIALIFVAVYRARKIDAKMDVVDKALPELARKATAQYKAAKGCDHKEAEELGRIIQLHH